MLDLPKLRDLRYGENPHQKAAWYGRGRDGFGAVDVLQGKELSFTNLLDLDSAARIVLEFTEPAAAVIKHTNPCGAATGASAADAYVRAREADALAAFGGIVGLNRPIDVETANAITSTFIEAVIAPGIDDAARSLMAKKPNMRVVVVNFDRLRAATTPEVRSILGAVLVQERDVVSEAHGDWPGAPDLKVVTRRTPTAEEWQALRFAWRVCAHVKSNTIIFTNARQTLAIGAGQMSRVDAVKTAVLKAQAIGRRRQRAGRLGRGLRCVLPVPRRAGRGGRRRRQRRRAARRLDARRRGDCRRRRTRHRDGVYGRRHFRH